MSPLKTLTIFLDSITWFFFVMETHCVFCELGNELHYILSHETFYFIKIFRSVLEPILLGSSFHEAKVAEPFSWPITSFQLWYWEWMALYPCCHPNSSENSPSWEASTVSSSQEIPHIVSNTKVYCHLQKGSALHILSQINPSNASYPHLLWPYIP